MNGQKARLGSQGRLQGLAIGLARSIQRSSALAGDLSAHDRHRPLQTFGDLTNRRTRSDSSRDVLWLRQGECYQRAPTGCRNNPAVLRQHEVNGNVVLALGTPNLIQRFSCLPTPPHVNPLHRGKLHPSLLRQKHHLSEIRFITDGVASTRRAGTVSRDLAKSRNSFKVSITAQSN